MNNRTNGRIDDPPPEKPQTMQELLDSAHNDWKFKRRDEAFMKVLNAMAMMSQGVAQCMSITHEMKSLLDAHKPDGK